jgi:Tol biopolymer transport system component
MNGDGTNPQRVLDNEVNRCSVDPFPADTCQQLWNEPAWAGDGMRLATTVPRLYEIEVPRRNVLFLCTTSPVSCSALGPFPQQMTTGRSLIPFIAEDPAWSRDGTRLAYVKDGIEVWHPADYRFVKVHANTAELAFSQPAWSPDGARLALVGRVTEAGASNLDIWVMNADGTGAVRLTNDPAGDTSPAWSPDGSRIAFASSRDMQREIYVMRPDGTDVVNLTRSDGADDQPSWSPDGSRIAFQTDRDGGNLEIYVMDADGQNPVNLTNHPAADRNPVWGP